MDVAAVATLLLRRSRALQQSLGLALELGAEDLERWVAFLIALHDVGKFAPSFQSLARDLFKELQPAAEHFGYTARHDAMGLAFWKRTLLPSLRKRGVLELGLPEGDDEDSWDLVGTLISAVTGHHGKPPEITGAHSDGFGSRACGSRACEEALAFALGVAALLSPPSLNGSKEGTGRRYATNSWLLAGLTVTSDWIGSNQAWFPYCTEEMPLSQYWERALSQAQDAVEESGVLPPATAPEISFGRLFPSIAVPSPLQTLVAQEPLDEGPQLIVIEDSPGSGKTEAAIHLGHRLLANGFGDTLYVALPTMATANAMFHRMRAVYEQLFEGGVPSLLLAHSARHLLGLKLENSEQESPYVAGEETASTLCASWLADSRKKSLLGAVGVGTVDQALLAAMPSKFNVMRLMGLQRSVLVVDEVHACDAYMGRLLEKLLRFQAALGSSVLLLSATLSQRLRRSLVEAYCEGLGAERPELKLQDFPLVTHVSRSVVRELPALPRVGTERDIEVCFLQDTSAAVKCLLSAVQEGRCACWIRNTVADAVEAFEQLVGHLGPENVLLFHARFAMGHRLEIEQEVLSTFGAKSSRVERSGKVLIATQVVEQSLDLDFDVLVTDLAPVDLVIQRAGRLYRHPRTVEGDRREGPEERPPATLYVFAPAWTETPEEAWYGSSFPRAKYVYPNHGQLWLTQKILREVGRLHLPREARRLIEAVYAEAADEDIPTGLRSAANRVEGATRAALGMAEVNGLEVERGYGQSSDAWVNDAIAPTRLGDESVQLRLCLRAGEGTEALIPADRFGWDLSQVTVRRTLCAQSLDNAWVKAAHATMPDGGKWCVTVVLTPCAQPEEFEGEVLDVEQRRVVVTYSRRTGLRMERRET